MYGNYVKTSIEKLYAMSQIIFGKYWNSPAVQSAQLFFCSAAQLCNCSVSCSAVLFSCSAAQSAVQLFSQLFCSGVQLFSCSAV